MELITAVTPIRTKVWFELENGEKYWLPRQAAMETGWQAGDPVDREAFRKAVLLRQYPHGLNLAVAMLARRPCSRGEIEQKLNTARYMDETVEMVLYKLDSEHLLDDREFAAQWARSRFARKYGAERIRQELKQKGVPEEDIENALAQLNEEEGLAQAVSLARKGFSRAKPEEDARKTMQRVISSLVRRGYAWETAKRACAQALAELKEEGV